MDACRRWCGWGIRSRATQRGATRQPQRHAGAAARFEGQAEPHGDPGVRILIFGTCYCASPARLRLLDQWAEALQRIAPTVDQLIVDSQSPEFDTSSHSFLRPFGERHICPSEPALFAVRHRTIVSFPENLGQLERGGRDGWGRAFSQGLRCGFAGGHGYVGHLAGGNLSPAAIPKVWPTT